MGMKTKFYYSNTQKQNAESFSNFTELFVLSLLKICITVYFILPSEYSNLKLISAVVDILGDEKKGVFGIKQFTRT